MNFKLLNTLYFRRTQGVGTMSIFCTTGPYNLTHDEFHNWPRHHTATPSNWIIQSIRETHGSCEVQIVTHSWAHDHSCRRQCQYKMLLMQGWPQSGPAVRKPIAPPARANSREQTTEHRTQILRHLPPRPGLACEGAATPVAMTAHEQDRS
jgi:hypothetical protein